MKETVELPELTANKNRVPILAALALSLVAWLAASGCSIKRTIKTAIPPKSKTATYDELLTIIRDYDKIHNLSAASLRLTLTYGKRESGELQEYRSAPGHILLRRPDSTHLVLKNPVTGTTILDLLSVGDDLSAWIPSKNRFYTGKNSAKELVAEDAPDSPAITIRATHIFEAILPQSIGIDSPDTRISKYEAADAGTRYYVLSVYREETPPRIYALRKIWIERMGLTIARQQIFVGEGQIASDILYSKMTQTEGLYLPLGIHIDRPLDGYALNLEFKGWRINRGDLPENAFVLTPPPQAEIKSLKEKIRSDAS